MPHRLMRSIASFASAGSVASASTNFRRACAQHATSVAPPGTYNRS